VTLSGERPGAGEVYACIDQVFTELALPKDALNCIAFGCGPGGFTGVRIAAAVTQGLAYGLDIPVFRFSSLGLLAAAVLQDHPDKAVMAAFDARQSEAYVGCYRLHDGVIQPIGEDKLLKPDEYSLALFDAELETKDVVVAGLGWQAYPEMLAEQDAYAAEHFDALPMARSLLPLAGAAWASGDDENLVTAFDAQPNYLRDKVTD